MNYWQYHDKQIKQLKSSYSQVSKQTQKRIQEMLNLFKFDFESLYSIANNKNKKLIDIQIEEWEEKGLLQGEFGSKAENIRNRTRVKNNEILELLIYGANVEEQDKLQDKELTIIKQDMNYYYQEGQKEVNKTFPPEKRKMVKEIPEAVFLILLDKPIIRGYLWSEYIQATMKFNSEQIYRQAVIDMQQLKEVKIDSDIYQGIINKQQNARLSINGDKISGSVDNAMISLDNQAKAEGIYSFDDKAKVKFIAVEDNVTTKMCHSLNEQEFNVHDWNEFERYSDTNKSVIKYKCYGLVPGLNMPPIDDHFHWCRSTLIYIKPVENQQEKEYNDLNYPSYIRPNVNKGYNFENEVDKIVNAIVKLPPNVRKLVEDTEYEIFSKGKIYRNNKEITSSFYDRNQNKIYIITGSNLTEGEVIHEIGHAVETKLNILNNEKYITVRNKGLQNYNKQFIKHNDELNMDGIKNSKFISDLQGKIYNKDLDGKFRTYSNGNINLNCLGDYFSEGFRAYFEESDNLMQNDKDLFEYIRGVINGI